MISRNPTVHMGYALIMLCAATACYVLDDFTVRYFNNYGNFRFGVGKVQVNVTYPRYGIYIPTEDDYLIENVQAYRSYNDYSQKSLKLEYTAFSEGPRAIAHFGLQRSPGMINVPMRKGRNVVVIPFSYFKDVNVAFSAGLGIGGPLYVHSLEIIVADSPADNVICKESVLYTGFGQTPQFVPYSGTSLRRKESPPHWQFVEYWDSEQSIPFINKNMRGFRRGGYGITKSAKGISIKYGGFLFQNLVNDSHTIDLTNKLLRLSVGQTSFPVNGPIGIDIKIQYHRNSVVDGAPGSSLYTLTIQNSNVECFDIPFSAFPDFRYLDVKRIWIYGPVVIHQIELVSTPTSSRFPDLITDSDSNNVLVDNLSNWPDSLDHANMVINFSHTSSEEVNVNGFKYGLGINSLNYPCYGTVVSLGDGGIELSDNGFIYEQLASADSIYDLSHATLEIEYSADVQITRKLRVHTVIPDDTGISYHVHPVELGLVFLEGKHKTISINLSECGPSIAFYIIGHGIITLHQMSLQISLPGQLKRSEVVDDFADWPLLPDDGLIMTDPASSTPGSIGAHFSQTNIVDESVHNNLGSVIYDYRQIRRNKTPVHQFSKYVEGHGVEIHMVGQLIQPLLPGSARSNLIITYSAVHSATRKITFLFVKYNELGYREMHVVFSAGESQVIVIKVPSIIANYVSHVAVIINGPLTMHQAEFVEFADLVELLPGQSTANALLIDDFSNWRLDLSQPNNLYHELYSLMPNGLGTVTLHGNDQYLIEGFSGKWTSCKLYDLSLRITYTLKHKAVCYTSLIPEPLSTMEGLDPYDTLTLQYIDMEFDAGVNNILTKPLEAILDASDHSAYHGFIINGPMRYQDRQDCLNNPLIIHRIEFIAYREYEAPMVPEYNNDQSFHCARRLTPESLIGVSFDQKLKRFRIKLSQRRRSIVLPLSMERGHILRDTYDIVKNMDPRVFLNKIRVLFKDEAGYDLGGLTREFFTLAANEINNPNHTLFVANLEANHALHIKPESMIRKDALDQFRHIGRIIGMAILNENLMGIRFVPSLYRKLVDEPNPLNTELPDLLENDAPVPDISELEAIDEEKYLHFTWLLNTEIAEKMSEQLALSMSVNQRHFDIMKTIDLVKNGRNIKVTQSNKNQYVQEYAKWHIIGKVEAQANALRDGVWDVIPRDYLAPFSVAELELLIAGISTIDVDDWERNASYINQNDTSNQYLPCNITIKHFWTCVRSWKADQHTKLLVFVTGSPRLPRYGFKSLMPRFTIIPEVDRDRHPRSSTCFNTLYLSPYNDFDVLCDKLSFAINETGQFALA